MNPADDFRFQHGWAKTHLCSSFDLSHEVVHGYVRDSPEQLLTSLWINVQPSLGFGLCRGRLSLNHIRHDGPLKFQNRFNSGDQHETIRGL